jgi:uncharacterized RDD family membrane protein YckC
MKPAQFVPRLIAYIIDGVISCIPFVGWIYIFTKDALPFLKGQSIGRKVMKLKCVMEDGSSMEGQWGPCIIRQIVFCIPFFGLVELYMVLVKNKETGIRFGDQWAKTKVVSVE